MRIEIAERVKIFTIFDIPKLDPVTVVLQDFGRDGGRLILECYGSAWSGYWGSIGDREITSFLLACNPSYIAGKMVPNDRKMDKNEETYLKRIVEVVHSTLSYGAGG